MCHAGRPVLSHLPRTGTPKSKIGRLIWNVQTGEVLFAAGPTDVGLDDAFVLLCEALS